MIFVAVGGYCWLQHYPVQWCISIIMNHYRLLYFVWLAVQNKESSFQQSDTSCSGCTSEDLLGKGSNCAPAAFSRGIKRPGRWNWSALVSFLLSDWRLPYTDTLADSLSNIEWICLQQLFITLRLKIGQVNRQIDKTRKSIGSSSTI